MLRAWDKLPTNESIRMLISDILKDLGISTNVNGYYQLRYLIEFLLEDMSRINSITKTLYQVGAKAFDTTPTAIERNCRHAIEAGWVRGNMDTQKKLFGYTISMDDDAPTVSVFLCTVADYVQLLRPQTVYNDSEYNDVDGFKCSGCGIQLEGWTRVVLDEDDGDILNYEYAFRSCPNCGNKIVDRPTPSNGGLSNEGKT